MHKENPLVFFENESNPVIIAVSVKYLTLYIFVFSSKTVKFMKKEKKGVCVYINRIISRDIRCLQKSHLGHKDRNTIRNRGFNRKTGTTNQTVKELISTYDSER